MVRCQVVQGLHHSRFFFYYQLISHSQGGAFYLFTDPRRLVLSSTYHIIKRPNKTHRLRDSRIRYKRQLQISDTLIRDRGSRLMLVVIFINRNKKMGLSRDLEVATTGGSLFMWAAAKNMNLGHVIAVLSMLKLSLSFSTCCPFGEIMGI